MTRKATTLFGASALLLSLALLAPPPSHAQPGSPGELVGALIERVVARWEALWHRNRQPLRKEGPMTDSNGCPVATTTSEEGPATDPDGSAATSEAGPMTDPDG